MKNLLFLLLVSVTCLGADAQVPRAIHGTKHRPPRPVLPDPTLAGDVVARDLDLPGVGYLGHVGMWDGAQIYEVLNEGGNVIRLNSLYSFKTRIPGGYWGGVSPNIPNYKIRAYYGTDLSTGVYETTTNTRMAILKKAWQQYLLGADYTLGFSWKEAYPTVTPRWGPTDPPLRGLYRCDTFIIALYNHTVQPLSAGTTSDYWPPQTWSDRVHGITWPLPYVLFDTLMEWL